MATSISTPSALYCEPCSKEYTQNEKFCSECGNSLTHREFLRPPPVTPLRPPPVTPRGSRPTSDPGRQGPPVPPRTPRGSLPGRPAPPPPKRPGSVQRHLGNIPELLPSNGPTNNHVQATPHRQQAEVPPPKATKVAIPEDTEPGTNHDPFLQFESYQKEVTELRKQSINYMIDANNGGNQSPNSAEANAPFARRPEYIRRDSVSQLLGHRHEGRNLCPRCLTKLEKDEIDVHFTTILNPGFEFNDDQDMMVVRMGGAAFGNMRDDCLQMRLARTLKDDFLLFEGSRVFKIHEIMDKELSYMYMIIKEDTEYWEIITKNGKEGDWHRCLHVHSANYHHNGIWIQYDWPVQMNQEKKSGLSNRLSMSNKRNTKDREMAVSTFLPNWEGFQETLNADTMEASRAIEYMDQVWVCLTEAKLRDVGTGSSELWDLSGFDMQKSLLGALSVKINSYRSSATIDVVHDQLLSSLTICYLVDHHNLPISDTQLNHLWNGLMLSPCGEDDFINVLQNIKRSFGRQLTTVVRNLESQCIVAIQKSMKTGDHRWLLALPLLHCLRGDIKPFSPAPIDAEGDNNDPGWWGLRGLNANRMWLLRADSGALTQVHKRIASVSSLVELDPLLPRTCLWLLLTCKEQRCILADFKGLLPRKYHVHPYVLLSALEPVMAKMGSYQSEPRSPGNQKWDIKYIVKDVDLIGKIIISNLKYNRNISSDLGKQFIKMAVSVTQSSMLLSSIEHHELVLRSLSLMALCIASLQQGESTDEIYSRIRLPIPELVTWLRQNLPVRFFDYNIKENKAGSLKEWRIWKELFKVTLPKVYMEEWKSSLLKLFQERLQTTIPDSAKVKIAGQYTTGRSELDHVIHQTAVTSIEAMLESQSKSSGSLRKKKGKELESKDYQNIGELMSELLRNSIPDGANMSDDENQFVMLQTILEWQPIVKFINMYSKHATKKEEIFDSEGNSRIVYVIQLVDLMSKELVEGTIQLRKLYVIVGSDERLQRFMDIFKAPVVSKTCTIEGSDGKLKTKNIAVHFMETLLKMRQKELRDIEAQQPKVKHFVEMCQSLAPGLQVDTTQLVQKAIFDVTTSHHTLMQHCTTATLPRRRSFSSESDTRAYTPVVKLLVPAAVMSILDSLYISSNRDNQVFNAISRAQVELVSLKIDESRICSSNNAAMEIWQPVIATWMDIQRGLNDGSITCDVIQSYFVESAQSESTLREELCKFSETEERGPKWLSERTGQILQYFHLNCAVELATVLVEIVDVLELSKTEVSEIGSLEELATSGSQSLKAAINNPKLTKLADNFSSVDAAQVECIRQIAASQEVVKWIRNNIRDAAEFFEFTEQISVRELETDSQFDAMKAFSRAVDGYAPLIFGLVNSATIGDIIEACRLVWNNLQYDRHMAIALRDSQRYLPMLQQCRDSHGSFQTTAIQEVETINARGVYTIGKQPTNENDQYYCQPTKDLFQLMVSKDPHNPGSKARMYDLHDLQELLRRLTLMSSSVTAKREKQAQMDYFTEVLALIQQVESTYGELCDAGCMFFQEWGAKLNCFHYHSKPSMVAHFGTGKAIIGTQEITKELHALRILMNSCVEEWRETLESARARHYHLNCFTNKQLTQIRQGLAVNAPRELSLQVYALLGQVKTDCCKDDVDTSMARSKLPVENRHMINTLNQTLMDTAMKKSSIEETFQDLWRTYLQHVASDDLGKSLTLQHLGVFLENLASLETPTRRRVFTFKEGRPNLIPCEDDDILVKILSLYDNNSADDLLPSSDEVLICNGSTTEEQVDLLFRRSFGDNRGRVFCLGSPESLKPNVSTGVLKRINVLLKKLPTSKFRLLIVYDTNTTLSPLVQGLSQYKTVPPQQRSRVQVKAFLERCLSLERKTSTGPCHIQVLTSTRSGTGKSLEVNDRTSRLQPIDLDHGKHGGINKKEDVCVSVPIQGDAVDVDAVVTTIWNHMTSCAQSHCAHIIHIDVSPSITRGLDSFLFNLLVTGCTTDSRGNVWRKRPGDQYIVEVTDTPTAINMNDRGTLTKPFSILLPSSTCYEPTEVYRQLYANQQQQLPMKSYPETLNSAVRFIADSPDIQYAFRYLWRMDNQLELDEYSYEIEQTPALQILETLLKHCGTEKPSWRMLQHFATFVTLQLKECDSSGLCNIRNLKGVGFKKFVVQFVTRIAQGFTTPALKLTESTESRDGYALDENPGIYHFLREWNTSPHPNIFFNKEGEGSMTFHGCTFLDNCLVDSVSKTVLESDMVSSQLAHGLKWNGTNFTGDDDTNLEELCAVLGVEFCGDPDPTYKLTSDNVNKILAIHMRFRCGLPVVIMGDRGCGKTRLVRYMSQLLAMDPTVNNLIHVKVHGGMETNDIMMYLTRAENSAKLNRDNNNIDTILYFDEANASVATMDLIKEIMCDGRAMGQHIDLANGSLKIIASCNPYRRHNKALVRRFKSAGFGYHKSVQQRKQFQGQIPFGEMVYTVRPLPPSITEFVWDYGVPDAKVERDYILQMVINAVQSGKLNVSNKEIEPAFIAYILHRSHAFMSKRQRDECGLVTLRDVDRCLAVLVWFFSKRYIIEGALQRLSLSGTGRVSRPDQDLSLLTKSLILAMGVCFHARLHKSRTAYIEEMASFFRAPCALPGGSHRMALEISSCQDAFINEMKLPSHIARNEVLKQNVFLMVVCIELGIPLFLIGKPGTSKSLAKTLVLEAMEGPTSDSELFKNLRQASIATYQCTPKTTDKDIVSAFEEAIIVGDAHGFESFVSVVCLDEMGLAEGSLDNPLKILKPYLEKASVEEPEETDSQTKDVTSKMAFIGMSNWAVDPAHMNAGIVVILDDPDQESLVETTKGICSSDIIFRTLGEGRSLVPALAGAFLSIYKQQKKEYFGYPDFYNLIKMLVGFCRQSDRGPLMAEVEHCIRRNFDRCGSDAQWHIFKGHMDNYGVILPTESTSEDPYCTDIGLIRANVDMTPDLHGETRHMLVETENYAAVSLLQDEVLKDKSAIPFFGSSFRLDQSYTEMCRYLNRVKRCMENGRIVILVNHAKLFECLHDVFNLEHLPFAGQLYVELALGTNRVKCRIHKDFRLIVVANRDVVNNCFSAPLLGRFEKHFLSKSNFLTDDQRFVAERLVAWVSDFSANVFPNERRSTLDIRKVIVGYHKDTIPSILLREYQRHPVDDEEESSDMSEKVFQNVQNALIDCASAVARPTVGKSKERSQTYTSLENFLFRRRQHLQAHNGKGDLVQLTFDSAVLVDSQVTKLEESLKLEGGCIQLKDLNKYDTEQQFRRDMRKFYAQSHSTAKDSYLLLQCGDGNKHKDLVACATYYIGDERSISRPKDATRSHVIFLIRLENGSPGFRGFPGGEWMSVHIPVLVLTSRPAQVHVEQELVKPKPTPPKTKPKPPSVKHKPKRDEPYATFVG